MSTAERLRRRTMLRPQHGEFPVRRLIAYMAGGAAAAASVGLFGVGSQASPALRPLWTALHVAFLALGLWWSRPASSPTG